MAPNQRVPVGILLFLQETERADLQARFEVVVVGSRTFINISDVSHYGKILYSIGIDAAKKYCRAILIQRYSY